jgi:hypothetical protein
MSYSHCWRPYCDWNEKQQYNCIVALPYVCHGVKLAGTLMFRVRVRVLNTTFKYISVISWRSVLLVKETEIQGGENHRPVPIHWQTLNLYRVDLLAMNWIRYINISDDRKWLHSICKSIPIRSWLRNKQIDAIKLYQQLDRIIMIFFKLKVKLLTPHIYIVHVEHLD